MPTSINIEQFLELSSKHPIIDVRTPAEFEKGNIPGAYNLPLFTNEDRVVVGTIYKQDGRQPAILEGLKIVGPKIHELVAKAENIINQNAILLNSSSSEKVSERCILIHCWRGGMRSASVAWLLELYGYKVFTLKGGYKSFRRYVLASFNELREIVILGGRSGSGKTAVLKKLLDRGEQVMDLEEFANHKGSSFGGIGEREQPSQEQFENILAINLTRLNPLKRTWLEDESRLIGKNIIPAGLWLQMRSSRLIYLDILFNLRVEYLTKEYGKYSNEDLREAIKRISKRLGGVQTKLALEALSINDLKGVCKICLIYYDKGYDHGLAQREADTIKRYNFINIDTDRIVSEIIKDNSIKK